MNKIAEIQVLKAYQNKVDELINDIQAKTEELSVQNQNAQEQVMKQIEQDLEEMCALTTDDIYPSKHISCGYDGHYYGIAFDGSQNMNYFINPDGAEGNHKSYHCVIAKHSDASGEHYYEDGVWNLKWNETIFLLQNWNEIKENFYERLAECYKKNQHDKLNTALKSLEQQVVIQNKYNQVLN